MNEIDAFVRQQLYLEGLKETEVSQFNGEWQGALAAIVIALLARQGVKRIGELSKRDYRKLQTEIRNTINKKMAEFSRFMTKRMKEFMAVERALTTELMQRLSDQAYWLRTKGAKLWDDFNKSQATAGVTAGEMFAGSLSGVSAMIVQALKEGYADNTTISALIATMTGRNGIIGRFARRWSATLRTYMQTMSAYIAERVGRIFTNQYMWISVIDSNTTEICRHRNGLIYDYGSGPRPPAHYGCRSRTAPLFETGRAPAPVSFTQWITSQPSAVQDYALGRRLARILRKGDAPAADIEARRGIVPPISLTRYAGLGDTLLK